MIKEAICEIVFNTSMTGYLEIFTDPSYAGQGVFNDISTNRKLWINKRRSRIKKPWVRSSICS